jgi:uncharacterized protein YdhG (YjbR/CyaY superfamily)
MAHFPEMRDNQGRMKTLPPVFYTRWHELLHQAVVNDLILKENKMSLNSRSPKTIADYITAFPPEVQEILEKIRATIREAAPGAQETIKYGMPTFTLNGNLVHFAAYRKHIGFYPVPTGIEKFRKELSVYVLGKGSVQFPLDRPIPFELISRIVKFRIEENLKKAAAKGKIKP